MAYKSSSCGCTECDRAISDDDDVVCTDCFKEAENRIDKLEAQVEELESKIDELEQKV